MFSDGSPVRPHHMSNCLRQILAEIGQDCTKFNVHSFCTGRSNDLLNLGLSVETIKKLGRWHSNAVFRYLH